MRVRLPHVVRVLIAWTLLASPVAAEPDDLRSLVQEAVALDAVVGRLSGDAMVKRLGAILRKRPDRAARLPRHESLLAISPEGSIVGGVDGSEQEVALGRPFDELLQRAGDGILLVHNHPHGTGFSGADLGQLAKSGVSGIVVVGHDGSLYAASAGPAYDADRFESVVYPATKAEVLRQLRLEAPGLHVDLRAFDPHVDHIVAMALQKAKIIRYQAVFGLVREDAYARVSLPSGHVAESVGRRLKMPLQ